MSELEQFKKKLKTSLVYHVDNEKKLNKNDIKQIVEEVFKQHFYKENSNGK